MKNTDATFGSSAVGTRETKIRRCPRVTSEGKRRRERRGWRRTKRTTKIPKIENCRLAVGRRRNEEGEQAVEERDKGNMWKVERGEDPSIYQKRSARGYRKTLSLATRERQRERATRKGWKRVAKCRGIGIGVWSRGLGEGSVAMATSSPRDPRSSLPGLVEKGGPGRPPGRLGWAHSPNVTRQEDTRMSFGRDGERSECDEEGSGGRKRRTRKRSRRRRRWWKRKRRWRRRRGDRGGPRWPTTRHPPCQ